MCVTWLIHMWDITDSHAWHDSFICADTAYSYVRHDVTHMNASYLSLDLLRCVWHDHLYVWHVSFIRATWLIRMWNMTLSWHDSLICATQYMRMCDTTHLCVWHDSKHIGWQNLIGCLKLQVFFRKRATNYRALLQKMTYTDKASCDSRPPSISILGTSYELGWDTYVAVCCSV